MLMIKTDKRRNWISESSNTIEMVIKVIPTKNRSVPDGFIEYFHQIFKAYISILTKYFRRVKEEKVPTAHSWDQYLSNDIKARARHHK